MVYNLFQASTSDSIATLNPTGGIHKLPDSAGLTTELPVLTSRQWPRSHQLLTARSYLETPRLDEETLVECLKNCSGQEQYECVLDLKEAHLASPERLRLSPRFDKVVISAEVQDSGGC